jgi:Rnl2 family RNA ligase
MSFIRYSSIEHGSRTRYINDILGIPGFTGTTWQVTEKVDGANYSFIIADTKVSVASRSHVVDGGFYKSQRVIDLYSEKAAAIATEIGSWYDDDEIHTVKSIQIYGELHGHKIQNRVYYGNQIDFRAFDIRVSGLVDNDKPFKDWLYPQSVVDLCSKFEIPHVPVIRRSVSFNEAMSISPEFISMICGEERDNNYSEGLVIKPNNPNLCLQQSRVIIKNKSPLFSEKGSKVRKPKAPVEWTDAMKSILDGMLDYNTENRIRSAISKIGIITEKDFGRLLGAIAQDIYNEWLLDNSFGSMDKKEQNIVTKQVNREIGNLIRVNFINIIDGTF